MGYKFSSKIRIDLGELGDNNGTPFFVEIKNPKMMTWSETNQYGKIAKIQNPDEQELEMKKIVQNMIVSWNLIDMETEEPVNPKDEKALDRVPVTVMLEIFKAMKPDKKAVDETKNSSEQLDKLSAADQLQKA